MPLTFEDSLTLRQLSPDVFENIHPAWTWPNSPVVPGGVLMSLAAGAAYQTIPSGYALDNLHCQFLNGSNPDTKYTIKVQRTSNGKRFIIRVATVCQGERNIVSVTMAFISCSAWTGPAMRHTVQRQGTTMVDAITIDDLERGRTAKGGFMKFQRLPLLHASPQQAHTSMEPVVAHIIGPLKAERGTTPHILGLLNLSDYHVLMGPAVLNGLSGPLPAIGDTSGVPEQSSMKMFTSLNHTIHIHSHDFRADEMVYIEVTSPWTGDGRGLANSRIFSSDGRLLASCVQETFYVVKPDAKSKFGSKL
jgi:acyl-CoA thioesterase 8